ncbi:MAG: hypothetical protein GWO24_01585, partial [Akkermansiaceae bacterium]|nr:hypothetical protein [Akkermansiaceae bacterium]
IVRRLTAVEGLGSCTLVATDKTGTLTANELTVREIRLANHSRFEITGQGFIPEGEVRRDRETITPEPGDAFEAWIRTAILCNEAELHH